MIPNSEVLIVGVGSPFGADRLGWEAVSALQQSALQQRFPAVGLHYVHSDRPGSGLLAQMQGFATAIVIDAMQAELPAGSLRRFSPQQLSAEAGLLSSHGFGLAAALALGEQLGQLPPQLVVYGIEIGPDLAHGPLAVRILPQLEEAIANDLRYWSGEAGACE